MRCCLPHKDEAELLSLGLEKQQMHQVAQEDQQPVEFFFFVFEPTPCFFSLFFLFKVFFAMFFFSFFFIQWARIISDVSCDDHSIKRISCQLLWRSICVFCFTFKLNNNNNNENKNKKNPTFTGSSFKNKNSKIISTLKIRREIVRNVFQKYFFGLKLQVDWRWKWLAG